MQKQAGSALLNFPHCATSGARQLISQRFPATTVLHMLPLLPTMELTVAPLSPTVVELVTVEELFSSTEPALLVVLLELTELETFEEELEMFDEIF